jgi:hypothetical protein
MAVAEEVIRPRLHAKEHLSHDAQMVHVVGVNSHLGGAARHNLVFLPAKLFEPLNFHTQRQLAYWTLVVPKKRASFAATVGRPSLERTWNEPIPHRETALFQFLSQT